ncbi:MAG: hypothetical protein Q8K45_01425 [Rubrivivax sp.]|nr:hypothetical protein [Rubrivivax sp.]
MQSRFFALALLLTSASAAWGQAAPAESTAAEAAMERAKRAAAGPLKAIQQASRIRRRGEPDLPPPATAAVLAASAAVASAGNAQALPAPVPERVAPPVAARVLEADALAAGTAEVAPLRADAAAPAVVALPAMVAAQALLEPLPVQVKALSTPDPNIPARLLEQGPRVAEVEVELSLRADGTVAEVTLVPPVPRAWQRLIITALEQWRYEPMASPRTHRVRLVFTTATER